MGTTSPPRSLTGIALLGLAVLSAPACKDATPATPPTTPEAPAATPDPTPPAPTLVGRWSSVRFEGPECIAALEKLDISLTEAHTFELTAHLNLNGTPSLDTRKGTWTSAGDALSLQTEGAPALESTFAFNAAGELVIKDKQTNCHEFYVKSP